MIPRIRRWLNDIDPWYLIFVPFFVYAAVVFVSVALAFFLDPP